MRRIRLLIVGSAMFAALGAGQLVYGADGSDVVGRLGQAPNVVGLLTGAIGAGGAFGDEANADALPFLGDAPGDLVTDLFGDLDPLSDFASFNPGDDDLVRVVDDKVSEIAVLIGPSSIPTRDYRCGSTSCVLDTDTVKDVTEIRLHLAPTVTAPAIDIPFSSLGLPSVGFVPEGEQLHVELGWTLRAILVADANGLRIASAANQPELDLSAKISASTGDYLVNLGALKVRATTATQPTFEGHLLVDVADDGSLDFSFGDGTGFHAAWDLITEDSPLMGVRGRLSIDWDLVGTGVDPTGLRIAVDDVEMDMSQFVGRDLQSAAASLRDITRPLRRATSPLLEPIPGMSDFSTVLGGDDVTVLRLLETADSVGDAEKTKLSETLERLQMLDDIVARLESGNGWVPLGSFELVDAQALTPNGEALEFAQETLNDVLAACGTVCEQKVDELLTALNGDATPGDGGFRFDLPVLTDPASLAGLLLGRDVDLITFDTGKVGYDDTLDIPLARFFIFSVELEGPLKAFLHLKGGVDTHGIAEALRNGSAEPLLNGVYLQDPGADPVVQVSSDVKVKFAAGIEVVEVSVEGGPDPEITLQVPDSSEGGKLRPAIAETAHGGVGCALLEAPDARAEFGVLITATFDYWIDEEVEVLAQHTFLSKADICSPNADDVVIAEDDGNRGIHIYPGTARNRPAGEADTIKVFMRHDPAGAPTHIVIQGNDNQFREFPASDFDFVSYEASDDRPVIFRVVATDGTPFEKTIRLRTGDGPDQVFIDSAAFGTVIVQGGDDRVTVTAGSIVNGGPGDDTIEGSDEVDILGGEDGNDVLIGNGGFDSLTGGAGDDALFDTSPEGNCLSGNDGNDLIVGGPGPDFLNGDEPVCGLEAWATVDPRFDGGHPGRDDIVTGGGADHVHAGNGPDDVRSYSDGTFQPDVFREKPIDDVWYMGSIIFGAGGDDVLRAGNGPDRLHGGAGDDRLFSDAGWNDTFRFANGDNDEVRGGLGDDVIETGEGSDIVHGDDGVDTCAPPITGQPAEADSVGGADTVHGGPGADRIALEGGDDTAHGNDGADVICGHAGGDTINGGAGSDTAFGGTGSDTVNGDSGDDELYGNAGGDATDGGSGIDRIVGGSSAAGIADAGDTIEGGDEADVIIGDNGVISLGTPPVPNVFDLFANDPALGGSDAINGGQGEDRIFGGLHGDTIHGDGEDDHLEGNSGDDAVYGDAGEDDIIGGTSLEALPNPAAGQTAADASDTGETILSGGAGRDVILGDNGIITRPGGTDPIIGGHARAVTLLDRERIGAALAAVSGGDYVEGNLDSDRIYGQGGDDYLKGNEHDDFVEGNQGNDRLEGNDGEDDLIGGSSFLSAPGVGDPDGADRIAGGAGADVLLGDNAAITRATTGSGNGFDWDSVANSWLGQTARRSITLFDKGTLRPANFGTDVLSGGAGVDVLFGQDGDDHVYGGSDDDVMEGNGGNDTLYGDRVAPPTGDARESGQPLLDGTPGPDGQDDQIGGSSWIRSATGNNITGQRDGNDELHGDGNADVQLGDNGRVLRRIVAGQYVTHEPATGKPTIVRQAAVAGGPATALPARFDVGAAASSGVWGNDLLFGDDGDDIQLGQDGDDTLYGGADDDDMYGELGHDRMYGEAGEDAMVGDRGVITNHLVSAPSASFGVTGPPAITFTPFQAHPLDRRVDLADDGDGGPVPAPGMTTGGNDLMRGGPDHDSMHGAAGNDLMNGDAGGDYLFGANGVDVMWGGQGRECADPADLVCAGDRGENDRYVDYLFGGTGLKTDPVTGGADILDFRPRPGLDPAAWFEATSTRSTDPITDHQHHQGIDWIYGGWDRDVMQANVADNGPNEGDKLLDWTGAYNLYVHCPAAYGGYNDVRVFNPSVQRFLEQLAFALGAGKSLADVQTKGTSGHNELALVYQGDVKANSGSSYPTTPGHFEQFSCEP